MINIQVQSTLRTAPDLCTNAALAELPGSSGKSYTVCTQSDVYTYTCSSQYREANRAKIKEKKWDSSEGSMPFWARVP